MYRMIRHLGFSIVLLLTAQLGFAADKHAHPQELMQNVTQNILKVLQQNKQQLQQNKSLLTKKVEDLVLPNMDFVAMSKLVLGKNWRQASKDQRDQFVDEFKGLLIRTYSTSLSEYSDQTVDFLPFRESNQPNKRATVKSQIKRSSGPPIPINYSLRFKDSDGWKVYDIGIEGVSLVTNYRSSFSREIANKGIDHLIRSLKERNQPQSST